MIGNRKLKKKIYEWTKKYADKVGYRPNPDKETLDYVLSKLSVKLENLGKRYLPGKMVTEIEEEDRKIVYPYVYL